MRVLVGCEESGKVRDAFDLRGHEAWSNDLVPCRTGGRHLQMCVTKAIKEYGPWDIIILHPDCTAMSLSLAIVGMDEVCHTIRKGLMPWFGQETYGTWQNNILASGALWKTLQVSSGNT